jgi:hypothetical protein
MKGLCNPRRSAAHKSRTCVAGIALAVVIASATIVDTVSANGAPGPPSNCHIAVNATLGPGQTNPWSKCIAKKNANNDIGNPIHAWECKDSPNEVWQYDPSQKLIRLAASPDKCLATQRADTNNGNPIQLANCANNAQTRWDYDPSRSGIRLAADTTKCMVVQYTGSLANVVNGTTVVLGDCTSTNQTLLSVSLWKFVVMAPQTPGYRTGEIGDYCTSHSQCRTFSCVSHACSSTYGLGQWCGNPGPDNSLCGSGYCNPAPAKYCVPPAGTGFEGDFCVVASHCVSGRCAGNRCAPK